MTRPRPAALLAAAATLVLLACGSVIPVAGPASARPRSETPDPAPLQIQLASISPATIPTRGAVSLAGTVTNISEETWDDVNVAPFISASPITTREELDEAATSDPDLDVGPRFSGEGQFVAIGDLAPGDSAPYTIRLSRAELPISGAPGVYWIGVHALGTNTDGRDGLADGKARTFIPLLSGAQARRGQAEVALVVPLRAGVRRTPDGRIADVDRLATLLGPQGRLGRTLEMFTDLNSRPVTMLFDPALLDAAASLAAGDPELDLRDRETDPEQPEATDPEQADPGEPEQPGIGGEGEVSRADAQVAEQWLDAATAAVTRHPALALGYADPDIEAVLRTEPDLLRTAIDTSRTSNSIRGVEVGAALAPPAGRIDPDLLGALPPRTVLLLGDQGNPLERSAYALPTGNDLIVSDSRTATGGPGPGDRTSALELRQRILADAALSLSETREDPLVVSLPATWDPGADWAAADFLGGLEQRWLRLAALPRGVPRPAPTPLPGATNDPLPGSGSSPVREVPPAQVRAAAELASRTALLDQVLGAPTAGGRTLIGMALHGVSYASLARPREAREDLRADTDAVEARLARIRVTGSSFVTLSGDTGSVIVSLVNDLDHPVVVGVRAKGEGTEVRVGSPTPVRIGAKTRATVRLRVTTQTSGIHQITVTAVTTSGEPVGTALRLNLRTSQVGNLLWAIMGAAGLLLAVMIGWRIRRRITEHTWALPGQEEWFDERFEEHHDSEAPAVHGGTDGAGDRGDA